MFVQLAHLMLPRAFLRCMFLSSVISLCAMLRAPCKLRGICHLLQRSGETYGAVTLKDRAFIYRAATPADFYFKHTAKGLLSVGSHRVHCAPFKMDDLVTSGNETHKALSTEKIKEICLQSRQSEGLEMTHEREMTDINNAAQRNAAKELSLTSVNQILTPVNQNDETSSVPDSNGSSFDEKLVSSPNNGSTLLSETKLLKTDSDFLMTMTDSPQEETKISMTSVNPKNDPLKENVGKKKKMRPGKREREQIRQSKTQQIQGSSIEKKNFETEELQKSEEEKCLEELSEDEDITSANGLMEKDAFENEDEPTAGVNNKANNKRLSRKERRKLKKQKLVSDAGEVKGKPKKITPNYFLAVRVSNPAIHTAAKVIQDSIANHSKELVHGLIPLGTLHITLMVMRLENDDVEKAVTALENSRSELRPYLLDSTQTMTFEGLGHFKHEVLFAKFKNEEEVKTLSEMNDILTSHFAKEGITSTDDREFAPHLTLLKLSRMKTKKKKALKKIPEESYATWLEAEFGVEAVNKVYLCSMVHAKEKDGFYHCISCLDFDDDNDGGDSLPQTSSKNNDNSDDDDKVLKEGQSEETQTHQEQSSSAEQEDNLIIDKESSTNEPSCKHADELFLPDTFFNVGELYKGNAGYSLIEQEHSNQEEVVAFESVPAKIITKRSDIFSAESYGSNDASFVAGRQDTFNFAGALDDGCNILLPDGSSSFSFEKTSIDSDEYYPEKKNCSPVVPYSQSPCTSITGHCIDSNGCTNPYCSRSSELNSSVEVLLRRSKSPNRDKGVVPLEINTVSKITASADFPDAPESEVMLQDSEIDLNNYVIVDCSDEGLLLMAETSEGGSHELPSKPLKKVLPTVKKSSPKRFRFRCSIL